MPTLQRATPIRSRVARTHRPRLALEVVSETGSAAAGVPPGQDSRPEIAQALGDSMIRYFLVMAVTGASLLVADFVLGFFATGEPHGPGAIARRIHVLFSLATVVMLLGIHSIVYTYFVATGKWAKEVVEAYQLPDWISTQATKNKRRAFRFIMGSMTAIAIAAWLGAAADTRGPAYAIWHLGAAAFALAYNLGSFVVEYAVIVAHVRLLTELKDRADQLREERYGPEAAHAGEVARQRAPTLERHAGPSSLR